MTVKRLDDGSVAKDKKKSRKDEKPVYTVSSPGSGDRLTLKLTKAKHHEEKSGMVKTIS